MRPTYISNRGEASLSNADSGELTYREEGSPGVCKSSRLLHGGECVSRPLAQATFSTIMEQFDISSAMSSVPVKRSLPQAICRSRRSMRQRLELSHDIRGGLSCVHFGDTC